MPSTPNFFETPDQLRRWFEQHHAQAAELWIGLWKVESGRPSVRWAEVVDEALCFGWIDGLRRSMGDESWMIRVTPRKPGSKWSQVNLKRYRELEAAGLVTPAGRRTYEARIEAEPAHYSYENRGAALPDDYAAEFRSRPDAWAFFEAMPPSYRRAATWWVVIAKREETRRSRLATLIADCAAGRKIKPLDLERQKTETAR
jgi:uncharacterized protein YdeI (YjbR/CyaY-like superfamily)